MAKSGVIMSQTDCEALLNRIPRAPRIVTGWPRPGEAESGDGARGVTPSNFLVLAMVVE
jgi:hypothetical protein